jgi:hypothetical protein
LKRHTKFSDGRNTNEGMAELEESERIPSLASQIVRFIAKRRHNGPFDILKKIHVVNFEWVEAVRDFQTAEAREAKAICRKP